MNDALMAAILSMDSYEATDSRHFSFIPSKVGNWSRLAERPYPQYNLSITEYENAGEYTFAVRGTTRILSDLWHGYSIATGNTLESDAVQSIAEYRTLLAQKAGGDASKITLTGHSMGGGIAGFIASVLGVKAIIFNNMPFEFAASNAFDRATAAHDTDKSDIQRLIYDGQAPLPINETFIQAWATAGEPVSIFRHAQNLPVNYLSSTSTISPSNLHSQALLVSLLYAAKYTDGTWYRDAAYLLPSMFDDQVAIASGTDKFKLAAISSADAMTRMIAYTAIDQGDAAGHPFGDVAIKAMFDDARDIGHFVFTGLADDNVGIANQMLYKDFSDIIVQFSGHLAATTSFDQNQAAGIATASATSVSIDLGPSHWGFSTEQIPHIVGLENALDHIVSSVAGQLSMGLGIDFIFGGVAKVLETGITLIKAAFEAGTMLDGSAASAAFNGSAGGALLVGALGGNTSFKGSGGYNVMWGQASDTYDISVGHNIIISAKEKSTITLDATNVTTVPDKTHWSIVEGNEKSGDTFVFKAGHRAPLTIVYGGSGGGDTFDFEPGARSNTSVHILQFEGLTQENFLSLDPQKIQDYLDRTASPQGYYGANSDRIVIVNPSADDILKFNGQKVNEPVRTKAGYNIITDYRSSRNVDISGEGKSDIAIRTVDPNNPLKMVGAAGIPGNLQAYFTDAWTVREEKGQSYELRSNNVSVGVGTYPVFNGPNPNTDYVIKNTLYLGMSDLSNNIDPFNEHIEYKDWIYHGYTDKELHSVFPVNNYGVQIYGFNIGDFGLNFSANGYMNETTITTQSFAVSEWADAVTYAADYYIPGLDKDLLKVFGTSPAKIGPSISDPVVTQENEFLLVGKDKFEAAAQREKLKLNDFIYSTTDNKPALNGDEGNNNLNGSNAADVIRAGGGDDSVNAGGGDDVVSGDAGNDVIAGGTGNDQIAGGIGDDTVVYNRGDGNDRVVEVAGGGVSDTLRLSDINPTDIKLVRHQGDLTVQVLQSSDHSQVDGSVLLVGQMSGGAEQGIELITFADGTTWHQTEIRSRILSDEATSGDDLIEGFDSDDTIQGFGGNDVIVGGGGADSLMGGDGNDTIYIDQYDTWYSGDDGIDTLIFTGAGSLSYSLGQGSFENVTTSDGNDTIWGTDGANIINLGAGDDNAQGYGGDDIINGGAGADSLIGGDGNDTIYIDKDDIWYSGDAGVDTLIFTGTGSLTYALAQGGFENVTTAAGNDTIWGTDDANVIDLGAGDDSAQGYGGDDIIIGGAGADSLQGGDGNDTIYVDQDDTWYSGDDGIDTLIFTGAGSLTYALAQGGFENATTAAGDDTIWGTDDANIINLGGGNDIALTYGGNDVVDGGDGNDFIDGGAGNDNLTGGAGNDTFVFHAGFGQDTITDFTAGAGSGDVIQIDTNVFADFAAVMNAASQVGADTVITADASNVITLKNVTLSSLHQDDFSFAVAS